MLWEVSDRLGLLYSTAKELNNIVNTLPDHPLAFKCKDFTIGGEWLTFSFWDILECVQALYGNPDFMNALVFAPECHYLDSEHVCWIYTEMHTGDWWWKYRCACLFSLFDLNNQPGTDIPQVATTWCDCNPNHPILQQNTTHNFLSKLHISPIHYNWQYPQVDMSKAIAPCPATSQVHSDYQTRRDYQLGSLPLRTSKSISLLYVKTVTRQQLMAWLGLSQLLFLV